jgi:hypothetical protein
LDTGVTLPLVVDALPIPRVGPRILQLSPIPGNIYESDHFLYDCTADISQGDFRAVLAFRLAHGHLAVVHKCSNLQAYQVAHPLAIVCPLSEVPLAIFGSSFPGGLIWLLRPLHLLLLLRPLSNLVSSRLHRALSLYTLHPIALEHPAPCSPIGPLAL